MPPSPFPSQQYEAELTLLRQQLAETQAMLQETQRRLNLQDTPPEDWNDTRRQVAEKDTQMKGIIQRWVAMTVVRRGGGGYRGVHFQILVWFQKIWLQKNRKCFLKFHLYNPF